MKLNLRNILLLVNVLFLYAQYIKYSAYLNGSNFTIIFFTDGLSTAHKNMTHVISAINTKEL